MAKRRVRVDRLIIAILIAFIAISLIAVGGYKIYDLLFSDDSNNTHTDPKPIETTENVHVSIDAYDIYSDDSKELGFDFIIATLNFSSNEAISFDLGNLVTSEKTSLNQVSKYVNALQSAGYKIDKLNIVDKIVSDQKNISANILIPVLDRNANSLTIYYDTKRIEFDLNKNSIAATTLKLKEENQTIVVDDTSVYVSRAYISSTMLHNDERYPEPDRVKPYTFEITVKQTAKNVKIVDALYVQGGDEEKCLPQGYRAIDCDNIIDVELTPGISGGLFFEVYQTDNEVHDGTLLIKFSNSNDWIEVSTNVD